MWRVEVLFFSGGIIREKAVEEVLLGSIWSSVNLLMLNQVTDMRNHESLRTMRSDGDR